MQLGSLLKSSRRGGPDIWEFRYRDRRHNGRRIYRRIKVGTVRQFKTEASARKGIAGLIREINFGDVRITATRMTVAELVEHYRQRELTQDNTWKSYSTKRGYESYLKNWIVPRWGKLQTSRCQNDRSRNVAQKPVAGQIEFRKDSQHLQRSL
jgi:hypothetical protein